MKRSLPIAFLLIFTLKTVSTFSQKVCSPRLPGTDELPGCLLCLGGISSNNETKTPVAPPNGFSCGTIENNLFFTIRADSAGEIRMHILVKSCRDLQGFEGVLFDKNFAESSPCFILKNNSLPELLEFTGLVPFENYSLMLDGIDGDICKFDMLLRSDPEPSSLFPDPTPMITSNIPGGVTCRQREFELSIPAIENTTFYDWISRDFNTVSIDENTIRLMSFNQTFSPRQVTVTPYFGCNKGIPSEPFYVSIINASPGISEIDTVFCLNDTFNFEGHQFTEPGFYEFKTSDVTQIICDTAVELTLHHTGDISPEIECVADTFLNVLSFQWDRISLAEGYRVFINGDTASIQSNVGFFYSPNFPGEQVDISIEPFNARGCSFEVGSATCFAAGVTDISEKTINSSAQISPNPSSGIFNVSSLFEIEKIEVFDFSGKEILNQKGQEIDLSDKASGVYVLKIYTQKGVIAKRVFKN